MCSTKWQYFCAYLNVLNQSCFRNNWTAGHEMPVWCAPLQVWVAMGTWCECHGLMALMSTRKDTELSNVAVTWNKSFDRKQRLNCISDIESIKVNIFHKSVYWKKNKSAVWFLFPTVWLTIKSLVTYILESKTFWIYVTIRWRYHKFVKYYLFENIVRMFRYARFTNRD